MLQVIMLYIKDRPYKFTFEILVVGLLSYFVELMAGGICLFKHGKMNIQNINQQFYFLAGTSLRMSTEFTR